VLLASIILGPGVALAHPGHGKPGFLHSHDAGELTAWLLLGVAVFGSVCWMIERLWRRFRKP
jgi:hypothetical protein